MKAEEDFSSHSNQISKLKKKKSGNMVVLLRFQAFLLFCFLKYNFNFLFGQVFFFFSSAKCSVDNNIFEVA